MGMTRFFHDGREIGFEDAVTIARARIGDDIDPGDEPDVDHVFNLVADALHGEWGCAELLADAAGVYSTGMLGFGDEDDIPPLDAELWNARNC
jgi:hypothetical protein